MELDKDMKTVIIGPKKVFEKHGFASSEWKGHELCYAASDSPIGPFKLGGVIVSKGDVALNGRPKEKACYPLGNNHGGMVQANGKWYIFYHRHTNWTSTDRQGMAEEIKIGEDGSIKQVVMTSCGLNGDPLAGEGE